MIDKFLDSFETAIFSQGHGENRDKSLDVSTKIMHDWYLSYIHSGFNEAQAFELTKVLVASMTAAVWNNQNNGGKK